MNTATPKSQTAENTPTARISPGLAKQSGRLAWAVVAISACFCKPLLDLARLSVEDSMASHALLIPLISVYLVWVRRALLPASTRSGLVAAVPLALAGLAAAGYGFLRKSQGSPPSASDAVSAWIFGYVCLVAAAAALVFGRERMKAIWFPVAFLIFMVPMPSWMVNGFEMFLQRGSAEVTNLVFELTGFTFLRLDALSFKLPTITITVSQECSGIRSTYVLFITCLLAGHLFLRRPLGRGLLALFVIPLGLARNAFRIFVISWLCVHVSPEMINSIIHREGGPLFFAISLVPLFVLLFWLRRRERPAPERAPSDPAPPQAGRA